MEAKHIERLEQVVRVLRELPKEKRFQLDCWNICGTVACAAGWAASDPWFRRRGFKLKQVRGLYGGSAQFFDVEDGRPEYEPACGKLRAFDAVEYFFGMTDDEAADLFSEDGYRRGSKYDVIRRLESFIKKQRKELGLKAAA